MIRSLMGLGNFCQRHARYPFSDRGPHNFVFPFAISRTYTPPFGSEMYPERILLNERLLYYQLASSIPGYNAIDHSIARNDFHFYSKAAQLGKLGVIDYSFKQWSTISDDLVHLLEAPALELDSRGIQSCIEKYGRRYAEQTGKQIADEIRLTYGVTAFYRHMRFARLYAIDYYSRPSGVTFLFGDRVSTYDHRTPFDSQLLHGHLQRAAAHINAIESSEREPPSVPRDLYEAKSVAQAIESICNALERLDGRMPTWLSGALSREG